jgi:hypothetical protein
MGRRSTTNWMTEPEVGQPVRIGDSAAGVGTVILVHTLARPGAGNLLQGRERSSKT